MKITVNHVCCCHLLHSVYLQFNLGLQGLPKHPFMVCSNGTFSLHFGLPVFNAKMFWNFLCILFLTKSFLKFWNILCIQQNLFSSTLCIRETPNQVLLQTVMLHFIGSTLFVKLKKICRQKNAIFFKKLYPDTPKYVQWTIPSLLYQTRRKNPLVYKGLNIHTLHPNHIHPKMRTSPFYKPAS